jgi:hypothetical protein
MQVPAPRPLAAALLVLLPLSACGGGEEPGGASGAVPEQAGDAQAQRLRELAAAYYEKQSYPPALETLQPLLQRARPAPEDLIAAACIELKQGATARAR